jgi:ribosomal protein L21
VRGSVVEQGRGDRIRVYSYKKTQNANRRSHGHRQAYTAVKIEAIES